MPRILSRLETYLLYLISKVGFKQHLHSIRVYKKTRRLHLTYLNYET